MMTSEWLGALVAIPFLSIPMLQLYQPQSLIPWRVASITVACMRIVLL